MLTLFDLPSIGHRDGTPYNEAGGHEAITVFEFEKTVGGKMAWAKPVYMYTVPSTRDPGACGLVCLCSTTVFKFVIWWVAHKAMINILGKCTKKRCLPR
jgi:hypothetical protein